MIKKQRNITVKEAPAAIGPYSHAVEAGGLLYCSGQIPLDPKTGELVEGDLTHQTEQVLKNLGAVLKEAGLSWRHVVKTTLFITDMSRFGEVNQVYGEVLGEFKPARSTVEVSALPKGALIEIDCIAIMEDK